ncbi:MAG: acetyl-CoA C-acyltransferase [Lautropia sp.]|nr:acetyl-CoA C-acyltransferase [Lautropia sp.]
MNVPLPILGWCRTAVVPRHGAFRHHQPHTLAAPLAQQLLQQAGLPAHAVDALVLGNALGAGGNPARLSALAAGLPQATATFSIDSQCCAGLDAIQLAAALLASGQADIVLAGGSEAWSRAPIRQHRPTAPGQPARPYERPAFAPDPADDPEPAQAAAACAARQGWQRSRQDDYARLSHQRAVDAGPLLHDEILPLDGVQADAYPRRLSPALLRRMPVLVSARDRTGADCSISRLAIAPEADGAALILMASPRACRQRHLRPLAHWLGSVQRGGHPRQPMRCALSAVQHLLAQHGCMPHALDTLELHDAFAVQGLDFAQGLGIDPARLNPHGGGLARGHPIGASGAIALVRVLATLQAQALPHPKAREPAARPRQTEGTSGHGQPASRPGPILDDRPGTGNASDSARRTRLGLACIAAAGGLGTAALVSLTAPQ